MVKHIIITTCTKNKSTDHLPAAYSVVPTQYLSSPASVQALTRTRQAVWAIPASAYDPSASQHYAYDLYVRHPKTQLYRDLRAAGIEMPLRAALLEKAHDVEWFFLSAGYGLVHALELARVYQASFTRAIAAKAKIPYTGTIWKNILPDILDDAFVSTPVAAVHVFGSEDYVRMVRATRLFSSSLNLFDLHVGRATSITVRNSLVETVRRLFKI